MTAEAWSDRVRAVLEQTCAEQGVPVLVSDAAVVERVVVLLSATGAERRAQARSASTPPAAAHSEAPGRTNPLDRYGSRTDHGGMDHDVVDEGFNDRTLPVEVEGGPLVTKGVALPDVGVDCARAG